MVRRQGTAEGSRHRVMSGSDSDSDDSSKDGTYVPDPNRSINGNSSAVSNAAHVQKAVVKRKHGSQQQKMQAQLQVKAGQKEHGYDLSSAIPPTLKRCRLDLVNGKVYPDFDIVYLPKVLPEYSSEKLVSMNEEQSRQIEALSTTIEKTIRTINNLRKACDEWLALEQDRVENITSKLDTDVH